MSRLLTIALALAATTLAFDAQAAGDAAAGKKRVYTCTGCHGIPGYKNSYPFYSVPRIAGQSETYLINALNAYKKGERKHPTMVAQAKSFSDQDYADIAAYLSTAKEGTDSMRIFLLSTALALFAFAPIAVAKGNAAAGKTKSATCAACHGADGNTPIDANTPKIAGQHADYLAKVLADYRSGARANAVMAAQSAALKDEDIADLSAYYAAQKGDVKEIPHH